MRSSRWRCSRGGSTFRRIVTASSQAEESSHVKGGTAASTQLEGNETTGPQERIVICKSNAQCGERQYSGVLPGQPSNAETYIYATVCDTACTRVGKKNRIPFAIPEEEA